MKINIYEIDWRYSSTSHVLASLNLGLKQTEDNLRISENTDEFYFDVDMALEEAESLYGIAFVTIQSYITGTVSDLAKINRLGIRFQKEQLLKNYSAHLPTLAITQLELCDAMSNYFKHHDEWEEDWSKVGRGQKTVSILTKANITKSDNYPCAKAMDLLLTDSIFEVRSLMSLLSTWRQAVIEAVKKD